MDRRMEGLWKGSRCISITRATDFWHTGMGLQPFLVATICTFYSKLYYHTAHLSIYLILPGPAPALLPRQSNAAQEPHPHAWWGHCKCGYGERRQHSGKFRLWNTFFFFMRTVLRQIYKLNPCLLWESGIRGFLTSLLYCPSFRLPFGLLLLTARCSPLLIAWTPSWTQTALWSLRTAEWLRTTRRTCCLRRTMWVLMLFPKVNYWGML